MSSTTSPMTGNDHKKPISLLSLDAGGPQGVSQLLILKDVMDKLSRTENGDSQGLVKRPCEVFDMIGGVGTGGLIAIFLVILKMTAKDALDEFTNFVVEVFKDVAKDPRRQTEKLAKTVHGILERHGIAEDAKLIPTNETAPTSKLMIPIMYKNHVGPPRILRDYTSSYEPPVDLTIAEAMLATCSTPPIFTPTMIAKNFATFEYVSGDIGLGNPTREIIAEAHRAFGDEGTVSCLLSIGCGHSGVNAVPSASSRTAWIDFVERVSMDSEKTAQDIAVQMSQLTLYYRLSVNRGLEKNQMREWKDPSLTTAHTTAYLNDLDVVEIVNHCVDAITHGDGSTTLEQLKYSGGGKVPPPPLPPLTRNFVERKLPMEFIDNSLFEADRTIRSGSKTIVVTGIGGCGKTQLIRKLIEKYQDLFKSTFFIDGSSPDTIRRDIVRHVRALGSAHSQKSFDESMVFLSQALRDGERFLVIDNVDNSTLDLAVFLPSWKNGVVIITSRDHSRGQISPVNHLQLDVMTGDESIELLVRGSGQPWPPPESDRKIAMFVAEELGCHPIALVQAVSYMYNAGCSPASYITLLRSHRDRLLRDHPATSQVDMRSKTAFAAFDASYNILPAKAQKFWHLLSFFRWQRFPVELLTLAASKGFSQDGYPYLAHGGEFEQGTECLKEIFFSNDQWDPLELHSILATLRSHSLITATSAENATLLQMHPLVHEWGRLRIPEEGIHRFEAAAVRLLCCGARKDNYAMMQYLSNHVEALSFLWEGLCANDAASLGLILAQSGMYDKAAALAGLAHEIVKRELGPDHSETINSYSNLALVYHHSGRYAEAEQLQTEVLRRRKQLLGADHPDTIIASAHIAFTYRKSGRYAEAVELQTEVLRRQKQLLGADHLDTIRASANLADIYRKLGRYAEAVELQAEVLWRRKQLLGADYPDTIIASAHMAFTYRKWGRYAEAVELQTEVLRRQKQLLGVEHPDTITASEDLAVIYYDLGRYSEVEELHIEVLKKRTTLLGERHPDTIQSMLYLAQTYDALAYHDPGRYAEAEQLQTEVLRRRKQLLGADHPDTIIASAHMAFTYRKLGRYAEAVEPQTEVLLRRKQLVGVDHPDTIIGSECLAATYHKLGRYAEAMELQKEVLQRRKRLLGVEHRDTILASSNLAATYHKLGRHAEAEELDIEVLRRRKQLMGVHHPETIIASSNLAATYHKLGRHAKAEELLREVLLQRKHLLGVDHPGTIRTSQALAVIYHALGRYAKAEELTKEVLKNRTTLLGERHPDTIRSMLYLAQTYRATERQSEASPMAENALQIALETLGDGHPLSKRISEFLASSHDEKPTPVRRWDRFTAYMRSFLPL